ncbi:hypothetical protein HGM15179_019711 [Zosterops borbonicus]|uniref:Retroviral nucleocapsid Gag protein p24 C-terminal domain-containing protein n=1 Tax=Zosterops borbonicus TaxID=364589 RepID=A0A8K1FVP4_9PASS|nr:hypothetical protein HGM15179_019711 [Zosterops borbonicus]
MATTVAAAARTERLTWSRNPEPTGCPLPSDSDTDSDASDNQVTAFATRGRQRLQRQSQRVTASQHKQHSSELHQVISKLAQLLHHCDRQEQQTAASPQLRAQRDHSPFPSSPAMPPVFSVSMPAFTTNPIDERRAAVAKAAIMDRDWDDTNALSCPVLIANGQAKWEPYDWKILQKAKETVTTYGLRSEAARNIIQYIYTADLLCPADCTSIALLFFTPSQLLIFEREWKCLAAEEAGRHRQVGDPFYAIQPDMLTGHGAYTSSAVQLTYPVEMHQLAQSLALKALLLVPDKKKSSPYSTIKQGATEPYEQFIDRLAAALKDATDLTSDVQEHLFRSLAFENANSCTRTILATLPQGSPVDEMLVRATRAEQNNQNAAFMATLHDAIKHQGYIIAAALTNSKPKSSRRNQSTNVT